MNYGLQVQRTNKSQNDKRVKRQRSNSKRPEMFKPPVCALWVCLLVSDFRSSRGVISFGFARPRPPSESLVARRRAARPRSELRLRQAQARTGRTDHSHTRHIPDSRHQRREIRRRAPTTKTNNSTHISFHAPEYARRPAQSLVVLRART